MIRPTINALDIPPWSDPTFLDIIEARNQGYDLLIVNLHTGKDTNTHAEDNLRTARVRGMETAAYFALSSQSAQWHFNEAKKAAGKEWKYLRFVAIDVELPWVKTSEVEAAIKLVTDAGMRPVLYTGAWFWQYTWGNPTIAKDIPLWDADYDNNARFDRFRPYGGWTSRVAKQYNSKASDIGFLADANVVDAQWLLEFPVAEFRWPEDAEALVYAATTGQMQPVNESVATGKRTFQFTI